uniref:Uncharacterized protein n=1 Tax=Setaria italica TaxID=4555 RepID=K4AN62_SETIT
MRYEHHYSLESKIVKGLCSRRNIEWVQLLAINYRWK